MAYIIKNNLPTESDHTPDIWPTRKEAVSAFMDIYRKLSDKYPATIYIRNESGKNARGTINVEIDGFYYYVELYKVE